MEVSKVIKCAGLNILETSAVGLAAGTEDPGYPLYRLYDRDAGRLFRAAGAGRKFLVEDVTRLGKARARVRAREWWG
ncbi:MAG: hypothetical protein P8Y85_06030 [Nitrospirota bacterium]|jgi:hypothetical protein